MQSNGASDDISGGADIEPINQLLERLLFRKRNPPLGGAVHDYVAWMREVAGVTRAWCFDAWQGGSTVGIAWVYDDRIDILPTVTDKENMQQWLFRHPDPATGVLVGRTGGIEPVDIGLALKTTPLIITPTPDSADIRAAIVANLNGYQGTLAPDETMLLSRIRTAIGSAAGVGNYTLDLLADVPAASNELNVIRGYHMAHALEQWHEVLLQQMPRGRAWPRDPESNTSKYVLGFAKRLVDCEVSADQLYLEMRPETTVQLLPDWGSILACQSAQYRIRPLKAAAMQ